MSYTDYCDNVEEERIANILEEEDSGRIHGVMICNVDNFVIINEMFGHKYGDQVLEQVYELLGRILRHSDSIVRLKGDEFLIFVKDMANLGSIETLAREILKAISSMTIQDSFNLTASIGMSIYPFHGKEYIELKRKAYQSVFKAKANGKDDYRLYDSARTRSVYHDYVIKKKMGSINDAEGYFDFGEKKSYQEICIEMFRENIDPLSAINSILEISCNYLGFNRVYIYGKNLGDDVQGKMRKLRYANSGYEFKEESELEKILKEDSICRLSDAYDSLTFVDCEDIAVEEEIREYMKDFGVRQIMFFPIESKGDGFRCVIFENLSKEAIEFTEEELISLNDDMRSIQSYYTHIGDGENSNIDQITKLELFEDLDACVYIINSDTHAIEFANRKAKEIDKEHKLSQKCHEAFCNRPEPCDECPILKMDKEDAHANANYSLFNFNQGKYCKNLYSWLDVNEHKGKAIMISVDVDDIFMKSID